MVVSWALHSFEWKCTKIVWILSHKTSHAPINAHNRFTLLADSSQRLLKATFCARDDWLKVEGWRVFRVSPSYYSRSLLASWPSCTQRIKEGRDIRQNTRQPHSALARISLHAMRTHSTCLHSHTHTHMEDKVCVKTSADAQTKPYLSRLEIAVWLSVIDMLFSFFSSVKLVEKVSRLESTLARLM